MGPRERWWWRLRWWRWFARRRFRWWFPRRWLWSVATLAALAVPVLEAADFAQLRAAMAALILPLEVPADQPVRSDTTTEAAARLLLRHTNSADGANQSMKSYAGRNATVARQQNRSASLTRQNMRTSTAQSSSAVRSAIANHRVFCASRWQLAP